MKSVRYLTLGILTCALFAVAGTLVSVRFEAPAFAIRPVIYLDEEAAAVMKSAPVILLVTITGISLPGDMRRVKKPPEVGGPMTRTIPLYIARIRAKVLLTVRGSVGNDIEFYSWVWASGSHGGPRLFHPTPGSSHVMFLRREGGYLHTVGDYPSYDLEVWSRFVPGMLAAWNSGRNSLADPLERLVALRFRAEFESLSSSQLREQVSLPVPKNYYVDGLPDLARLFDPFFVATQLDEACRHSTNPLGRFAACRATAEEFPGRCQAYRLAEEAYSEGVASSVVARDFQHCAARAQSLIRDLCSSHLPLRGFYYNWNPTPEGRRAALRLYASAMDPELRQAACQAAAAIPEARGIPECPAIPPAAH